MNAATSPPEWTYAEYARLPDDGNRYEVLDGEVLTTPSPGTPHQRVAGELYVRLREYVLSHAIGEVLWDLDLLFARGQFLRPDIVYVSDSERGRLTDRGVECAPGLVVEVVSPSSRRIDLVKKPARYRDFGIAEYWAVDPANRMVMVWDFRTVPTRPRKETERVEWHPEPDVPPLFLKVAALFGTDAPG